jgi:hypothetical protein
MRADHSRHDEVSQTLKITECNSAKIIYAGRICNVDYAQWSAPRWCLMRDRNLAPPQVRHLVMRIFWAINLLMFALVIWWAALCFVSLR